MPSESDYMASAIVRDGLPGEVFRAELELVSALAQAHGGDPRLCCDECKRLLGLLSRVPCPTCDGDGGHDSRHDAGPDAWVPCPTCGGRGR